MMKRDGGEQGGFDFLRDDGYLDQVEDIAPVRRGQHSRRRWWYVGIGVVIVGAVLTVLGILGLVINDEEPDIVPASTASTATTATTTPTTAPTTTTTAAPPTTTAAPPTTTSND